MESGTQVEGKRPLSEKMRAHLARLHSDPVIIERRRGKRHPHARPVKKLEANIKKLTRELEATKDFGRSHSQAFLLDYEPGVSPSDAGAQVRYQRTLQALYEIVLEKGRNSVAAFRALDERAFGRTQERDEQREAGIQVGVSLKNYIENGSKPSDGKERAPLAINGPSLAISGPSDGQGPGEKGVGGPPIHPLGAPGQNTVPSPDHAGDTKIESPNSPIDVTGVFVDATKL